MHDLFTRTWEPAGEARAGLLVVHGYAEHSGRYDALAGTATALGMRVFSYDHRGHGQSPGKRGYVCRFHDLVSDLEEQVARVAAALGNLPLYLFGHSMGGLVSIHLLVAGQSAFAGAILSSPLLAIPAHVPGWKLRLSALLSATTPWLPVDRLDASAISRDPEAVKAYVEDPLGYHGPIAARTGAELVGGVHAAGPLLARIALPLLVMHGTADRLAPFAGGQALADLAQSPDKTFFRENGGYHELLNDTNRAEAYIAIRDWLASRIQA